MLDPDWVLTQPILWLALTALVALLVVRTVRKDKLQYRKFKRFRATAKRQAMMRKWVLDAFLTFGGLSIAVLILVGAYIAPFIAAIADWPGVRDVRGLIDAFPGIAGGILIVVIVATVALTAVGVRAAREEGEIPTIGDISAILPRNRQELKIATLLSVNAGVMEELLFRLALPTLIFAASSSAVAAVVGSILFFGALHLYQGVPGIIGTAVIGAVFMFIFAVSGAIWIPIVLHALFDLRSLVIIPAAVYGIHKIDGTKHPYVAPRKPKPKPVPVATTPNQVRSSGAGASTEQSSAAAASSEPPSAEPATSTAPTSAAATAAGAATGEADRT